MVIYFSSFFGVISLFFGLISLIFFHAFLTRCPKVGIHSPLTYNSININRFIKSILTTLYVECKAGFTEEKRRIINTV